ncbi:KIN14A1 [Auxenochlorella protothecoides x Auxenochlorella symbiontica]
MLQEWREQRAVRISGNADVKLQQSSAPAPSGDAGKENHGTTRPPMASHKVTQSQPEPHSAPSRGVNSIAARLESLKRESLRPSIAPPSTSQAGIQFEAAGPVDSTALRRLAGQLFDDESWKQLYDKGMNAKLTRSRDGATEETKIKELADMVKLLRRALKELQGRTQTFIDQSCRFERDIGQQVEAAKLSSESGAMAAHAELANARREAAAAAAAHKNALAVWKGELQGQQAEVARLRRESDRLQAEVTRLSGEARRSEAARAAAEEAAHDAKRAATLAAREASGAKLALERDLASEREASAAARLGAEAEQAAAKAEAERLAARRDAAEARAKLLEGEVAGMRVELREADVRLQATTADCEGARRQLAEHRAVHDRVVADAAAVLAELQDWQTKAATLLEELERERQRAGQAEAQNATTSAQLAESQASAAAREAQLQEGLAAALERAAAAEAAGRAAREAASAAQARCDELELAVRALTSDLEGSRAEGAQSAARAEGLAGDLAEARRGAEALEASLGSSREECAEARRAAADASARLQRLEGELEALQECTLGLGSGDQGEMLSRLLHRVGALEGALLASETRRRALHNTLVELRGNIRVFCRIRPHPASVVRVAPDGCSLCLSAEGREHTFAFDRVFPPGATQAGVYEGVAELVQSALDGYKVCLFSYGQTGAGKTHTMQGAAAGEGAGVVPRAVRQILAAARAAADQGWDYALQAAFVEVYNETLRDLLAERRGEGRLGDGGILHAPDGGHTTVTGATRLTIASEEDAALLVARAAAARSVEATAMNAASSRSHSVFLLYITGRHAASDTALHGSLALVDLAGSERLARSGAEGARAKETCSINKSLSALGDVFQSLAARAAHVPYRNSKLTYLLQPCLGGSGKTLMFVNINPEPESAGETLCSLRFAAKVNSVETAAKGGAARSVSTLSEMTGRPSLAMGEGDAARATALKRRASPRVSKTSASRVVRPRCP